MIYGGGILSHISEAVAIKEKLGVSTDEAFAIQREREAAREAERLAAEEPAESNIIQFRPRGG